MLYKKIRQSSFHWVPLFPRLRGHFAEFLRESYLDPLSICLLTHLCRFRVQVLINLLQLKIKLVFQVFLGRIRIFINALKILNIVI